MPQLVTRIDARLLAQVDELVSEGIVESRSDAVRNALHRLVDEHQRRRTAEAIIRGYEQIPQTEDEIAWADDATRSMIREEPW